MTTHRSTGAGSDGRDGAAGQDLPAVSTGRADHCTGIYVMHLFCCAPNDVLPNEACNEMARFLGDSHRDAAQAAKSAGWLTRVSGIAAWCPKHAGRTFEQRCEDFAQRAACTAPGWEEP